ncbi:MAG: hypothetical protein JOY91_09685 [Sinobacteraceae bacterium]|nr:hypothetical protein [Nevskiaceae bacterium]
MTLRIAMWSGPRNISTAMMRAFENRPDTAVSDEPFYGAYLAATGLEHPMRAEILASMPTDWQAVADALVRGAPHGKPVWYQKHMCHHMLYDFGLDWMDACTNVFLIRAPEKVLASYRLKRSAVTPEDIGFVRQVELFDRVAERTGAAPPVIEAADVLSDPGAMLQALCRAVRIDFSQSMLSWPAGRRASDGVWAPAWYEAVERSTGFAMAAESEVPPLPSDLQAIADAARPSYERLFRHRLKAH